MMNNFPIQNTGLPVQNTGRLDDIPVGSFLPVAPEVPTIQPQQGVNSNPITPNDNQAIFDIVMNNSNQGKTDLNRGRTDGSYLGDVVRNIPGDILEMAQGGITLLSDPASTVIKPIGDWLSNTVPNQSIGSTIGDVANALIAHPAGLDVKKTARWYKLMAEGKKAEADKLGNELRQDFLNHFRQDPLITTSVLAPNTVARATKAATRGTGQLVENVSGGKVAWGQAGQTASAIKDLAVADVAEEMRNVSVSAKNLVKEAGKAKGGNVENNLAEVIRRRENNLEIPERLKATNEAYDKFYDSYMKTLPAVGLESTQSLVMNQYRANKTGKTYNEAAREFKPLEEILYDGIDDGSIARNTERLKNFNFSNVVKDKKNLNKKINDLTPEQTEELLNSLTPDEINSLIEADMTIKDARNYLNELVGEGRYRKGTKLTPDQQIRYKENLNKISELAAAGDEIATDFLEAHAGWKNGTLRPTVKAGIKDVALAGTLEAEAVADRRFAGAASSREYGTATPEQIAKAYAKNIDEVVNNIAEAKIDRLVSERILEGTFPDGTPMVNETTKVVKHLDGQLLQEGRLSSALRNAKDKPFEGSVAIDEVYLNALKDQFGRVSGSLFTGILGDLYGLQKDAILSSGTYLGGNALSGAANMLLNSNVGLFEDMINAAKSKGELGRKLGVQRQIGYDPRKFTYAGSQKLHNINRAVGGKIISDADAAMQNYFAEVAAHARMRKQGIPFADRQKTISDMAKNELVKTINDVKNVALINPSRSLIPRGLQPIAGISPFWRWQDTATQATYHMLMQHPILSQQLAANLFGTIGFDREMQIREGLNVKTDKPLKTFRTDDRTGQIKEVTMDFLPQLTTVKALVEPQSLMRTIPVLGAATMAAQGKNAFGKPMQRTHSSRQDQTVVQGDIRYRRNPETGQIETIGGQADEILSTMAKTFSGVPNIVNKTAAPGLAGLVNLVTGSDVKFYQPYGQSLFGTFSYGQPDSIRAILGSGDPTKGRQGMDLIKSLLNQYEQPYMPENQLRMNRAFVKGAARRDKYENAKIQGLK